MEPEEKGVMRTLALPAEDAGIGDIIRHDGVVGVVSAILVDCGLVTLRFEAGGFVVFEIGEELQIKRFAQYEGKR